MKPARLLGLAGLLIALQPLLRASTQSEAAPLITRLDNPVSVPAEISGHQMFVNIMVNGHGLFRVMVETRCSVTVVSPELAEAVGATVQNDGENFLSRRMAREIHPRWSESCSASLTLEGRDLRECRPQSQILLKSSRPSRAGGAMARSGFRSSPIFFSALISPISVSSSEEAGRRILPRFLRPCL